MLKTYVGRLSALGDLALFLLRVIVGVILIHHGYIKLTHGFAIGFFGHIGIPIAPVAGVFITLLEVIGGIFLILGLFTRYLGVLFVIEFIVATYVKWVVMGAHYGGSELELLILFAAFLFATRGGGNWSVDKGRPWEP